MCLVDIGSLVGQGGPGSILLNGNTGKPHAGGPTHPAPSSLLLGVGAQPSTMYKSSAMTGAGVPGEDKDSIVSLAMHSGKSKAGAGPNFAELNVCMDLPAGRPDSCGDGDVWFRCLVVGHFGCCRGRNR